MFTDWAVKTKQAPKGSVSSVRLNYLAGLQHRRIRLPIVPNRDLGGGHKTVSIRIKRTQGIYFRGPTDGPTRAEKYNKRIP